MLTQLEKTAQRLSTVAKTDDGATLVAILRDDAADELLRITAFHRLVELKQMSRALAAGIRSSSDRLQRIALQYLASLPKESYLARILGQPTIRTRGAVRVRGSADSDQPADPTDWREQAASDPSPAIQRLSLLRD